MTLGNSSRVNVMTVALWFALVLLLFVSVGCERPDRKPTVWAFTATWCAPCQRDKPALKQLANSGAARVVSVDGDAHPELVKKFGVTEFPTYIVVHQNRVAWRGSDLSLAIQALSRR